MRRRRKTWLVVVLAPCVALLPCARTVRNGERWMYSSVRLSGIGHALRSYHDVHGRLPPAAVRSPDGKPLYSWRVLLLPYVEHDSLYKQFRLDEAWDGPNNIRLLADTPRPYLPHFGADDPPGMTRFQLLIGRGTAFERDGLSWADFPGGPDNTLLVVEAGTAVPWSKPVDLAYDPDGPLPSLGTGSTKAVKLACYELRRDAGFCGCFGDERGRFVRRTSDEGALRAFITRNGGEKVDRRLLD